MIGNGFYQLQAVECIYNSSLRRGIYLAKWPAGKINGSRGKNVERRGGGG